MKNRNKDEGKKLERGGITEKYFQHELNTIEQQKTAK